MWLFLDEEIKCKKLNILSWWFSFLTVIEGSKCLKFSSSFQFLMDFTAVNYKPLVSTVVLCIISCYKANSLEWWEAWQRSKYTGALDNHLLEVQGKMPCATCGTEQCWTQVHGGGQVAEGQLSMGGPSCAEGRCAQQQCVLAAKLTKHSLPVSSTLVLMWPYLEHSLQLWAPQH